jgi:hypothetical protein
MQIKTILNRIQKHRGFVYGDVRLENQLDGLALTVDLYPHARNRPQCAGYGHRGPQHDHLAPRRFEFVPLWGLRVFFLYMMQRVDCRRCGVTVEQVPWADGKLGDLVTTDEQARTFVRRWRELVETTDEYPQRRGAILARSDEMTWTIGAQLLRPAVTLFDVLVADDIMRAYRKLGTVVED